jgi:hypothetical protein
MSKSIQNLSLVGASIRPSVVAFASDFVFAELALVDGAISPFKSAFAMEKAVSQLTFVLVAILKDASALSMEYFANLNFDFSQLLYLPVRSFRSQ